MTPDEIAEMRRLLDIKDQQRSRVLFQAYYERMTGFRPQPHHILICKVVQGLEDDLFDRAMVFTPRRMAKSTLCTQLAPSWIMGKYPAEKIMSAVHTQKYAAKTGKLVRNFMRSRLYPFDTELAPDSQAKDQWATTAGGEYNGFGLMGGSTHGNPASWLFTDDLIKGRKMALSEHMREEAWETYKADLVSSLQGRQKQLLITTRWHMDDVAGRILPENYDGESGFFYDRETGEKWYVLCLPAAAERENDPLGRQIGEYMWSEEFGKKFDAAKKRGGWLWSALFQQRPSPEEGLMFDAQHLETRYDPTILDLTQMEIYGSSDYAVKEEAGAADPDYTVHMIWGVDPNFDIYLLDMWRERTTSDQWVAHAIRLMKKWKPLRWFEESGQIISGVGPFLVQMMRAEHVYCNRVQMVSSQSKEQRAHALLGLMSLGKVYLPMRDKISPAFLTNLDAFEKELLQFPAGKHEDTVDTATLFGRGYDRIVSGEKPKRPPQRSPHGPTLDELFMADE